LYSIPSWSFGDRVAGDLGGERGAMSMPADTPAYGHDLAADHDASRFRVAPAS
jgi:hypothetical protein